MADRKNMIAGLYDLGETIGEGHYAVVKLAKHVFTGEKVAVKVIDKMKLDQSTRTQMMQEVRLMKLVQHPNVVRLYEVIDTQTKLYLVLELGDGGDMYDYIMKHEGGLGEDIARKYFRQIVTAIQYCHKLHVVHRDLKPENVVFFEKLGMVKLTDFGFSNKFNPGAKLMTSCGSLAYSAPEILLGDAYDAPAVDIWSLGVILYMLVCGSAPFQEANDSETLTMIMDCNYLVPSHISPPCQGLINSMLCREPANRATLDEIACHEWVRTGSCAPVWDMLPLVTREHLTQEEHLTIIQKMVNGSIATREAIIDCLDRNEYNHVTATYFLLAERKLRAQRHDVARKANKAASKEKRTEKVAARPVETQADISPLSISSNLANKRNFQRMRNISIVEEEEEEEEEEAVVVREEQTMPAKGLSRHSSTSSLVDKSSANLPSHPVTVSPQLHLDLTLAFAAQKLEEAESGIPTPAPFPQSSQIGTGLSRQNSLRRSGESTSASSPCSERKSTPGSPGSPTAGHTSPARFKLGHSGSGGRKLGGSRTSPQLSSAGLTTLPVLNQIHEEREAEEGGASPCEDRRQHLGAPAGAAVLRRLEQRRRLHKSRTASCSSSEASDDDSENRKKRGGRAGYPAWRDGDPDGDHQGPPGAGGGGEGLGGGGGHQSWGGGSGGGGAPGAGGSGTSTDGGGGAGGGGGGGEGVSGRHYRLHRNSGHRVRQSYSLNRISEIHEAEQSDGEEKEDSSRPEEETERRGGGQTETERSRRQFTPQLSSESEGENSETLTRYMLDSLDSSDSEYNTEEDRRRNKVNLRHLEERLNMIQEECNRSDDEESDDERSATIDDKSDRNDQLDNRNSEASEEDDDLDDNLLVKRNIDSAHCSVFNKIDEFLDNSKLARRNSGRSRSEGWTFSDCEERVRSQRERRPTVSRGRPSSAPPRPGKYLHRAHSCGSLTRNGKYPPGFWNILSEKSSPITFVTSKDLSSVSSKKAELSLTLTSVPPPINILHLQSGTSRCCNLC